MVVLLIEVVKLIVNKAIDIFNIKLPYIKKLYKYSY
jgi:hypothetical protein